MSDRCRTQRNSLGSGRNRTIEVHTKVDPTHPNTFGGSRPTRRWTDPPKGASRERFEIEPRRPDVQYRDALDLIRKFSR